MCWMCHVAPLPMSFLMGAKCERSIDPLWGPGKSLAFQVLFSFIREYQLIRYQLKTFERMGRMAMRTVGCQADYHDSILYKKHK